MELSIHIQLEHPPPEPPDEEPVFEKTYREVDIYWLPTTETFWAQVAPGYIAAGFTVEECEGVIDDILEFLEPDEDPDEGLFAQVVAEIKMWVNNVIGDRLQPVYDWVDLLFAGARDAWEGLVAGAVTLINAVDTRLTNLATTVRDRWDTFNTLTLPSIWTAITNKGTEILAALDQAKVDLTASLTKGLDDVVTYIDGRILIWDPVGFLKDPLDYIGTAFTNLIDAWVHDLIGSLAEGLHIGIAGNPPAPEGPGASFKLGFDSVVNKKEGEAPRG
ncbi:hypothetical protein ES708_34668 [subsurface metagenome]